MAHSVDIFIRLANFYNQMTTVMSAVCVQKGGIAMENYVGRFFAADTLEFINDYAARMQADKTPISADVAAAIARFQEEYQKVKTLATPTQKPMHEMTLEEFEKVMNI
ncbi:MAG: hypothetical protein LBJ73_00535 [Rickettsiales bacterium]|jgi:hypothetical protein|nr:hypothetical protein [Rickettsiales bacterium]